MNESDMNGQNTVDLFTDYIQGDILDKYEISTAPPEFKVNYNKIYDRLDDITFECLRRSKATDLLKDLENMQVSIEKFINMKLTIVSMTNDNWSDGNWVKILFLNHPPRPWNTGHEPHDSHREKDASKFSKESKFRVWFQYGTTDEGTEEIGTFSANDKKSAIDKGLEEYTKDVDYTSGDFKFIRACIHSEIITNRK